MRHLSLLMLLVLLAVTVSESRVIAVDYAEEIKPLFKEKCSTCHGALRQEAGLRLDAAQLIRGGGDSGAVVSPGAAAESLLFQRVIADESMRMPPEGEGEPLNEQQIALLKSWIDAGAVSPDEEAVPAGPQDHWAYQVPRRPDVPDHSAGQGSDNPIDAFIAKAQQDAGVTPYPPADKLTLLRRVTLDLIGLPPTREDMHAFLNDTSPTAYEQIVDRLLESPQHGERWARHWMDVWRYSDWDGYKNELRGSQRHIWRWRDWIIESLNADKGYDQMIREMLAGDEIAPQDRDTLRATGFLARNYHNSNRDIWLDATVEHTAKAFLGMTINCARCHDHKYDPIAQTDYYAFRAIFEPHRVRVDRLPGEPNVMQDGLARAYDADLDTETFLYVGGNEKHPDKENPLGPGVPDLFGELEECDEVALPIDAWFPSVQEYIRDEQTAAAETKLATAKEALTRFLTNNSLSSSSESEVTAAAPPPPPLAEEVSLAEQKFRADIKAAKCALKALEARWKADVAKYVRENEKAANELAVEAARLERQLNLASAKLEALRKRLWVIKAENEADESKRKQELTKAQKELATAEEALQKARDELDKTDGTYTSVGPVYPRTSSGRRSALAEWITDRENPLTARVAVNHVWMRHFGEPLVENVFDFGLRSPRPVQGDLLDWLAVEFMESGWSMKRLHRLIVTSDAYCRASSADTALAASDAAIDADNRLLWKAEVQRLEAEAVRDSVLAACGSLDTTTGGPDIDYADGEKVPRRSVYFRHAYEKQMTMLVLFDAANPTDCYRRSESIVPQQALTLANSMLTLAQSRKLARQLWEEASPANDAAHRFVKLAFEQLLNRPPTEDEFVTCTDFLRRQAERLTDVSELTGFGGTTETTVAAAEDPAMRARENLVHVLMNHNDFVTVR